MMAAFKQNLAQSNLAAVGAAHNFFTPATGPFQRVFQFNPYVPVAHQPNYQGLVLPN